MADDAERFSSFPRLEGHFPMNLEAGGGGGNREKRDAAVAEGDQGECSHCRRTGDTISYPNEATRPRSVVTKPWLQMVDRRTHTLFGSLSPREVLG